MGTNTLFDELNMVQPVEFDCPRTVSTRPLVALNLCGNMDAPVVPNIPNPETQPQRLISADKRLQMCVLFRGSVTADLELH